MKKICMMDPKYNKCPYVSSNKECKSIHPCNMIAKLDDNPVGSKYVRQPRWYEQYYIEKK